MPRDHCHVAGNRCVNPPGFGTTGGGYYTNPKRTSWKCPCCDEATCARCRTTVKEETVCDNCAAELEKDAITLPKRKAPAKREVFTFMADSDDMEWLRDVHGIDAVSANVYGNEDAPDRVEAYDTSTPTINTRCRVFVRGARGKLVRLRKTGLRSKKEKR